MNISSNYSYYTDPNFAGVAYSRPIQVYYIVFGTLAALGNLYLVVLFSIFPKLRSTQCNWLIIFLCLDDVFIGIGVFIRGLVYWVVLDNNIMNFDFYFCTVITAIWICGYRVSQTIALLMAFDRLLAIWKPIFYAKRQGNNLCFKNSVIVSFILIVMVFCFLLFFFVFGAKLSVKLNLISCLAVSGIYYLKVVPAYSGIVSIIFFVTYVTSLLLFTRRFAKTMKNQAHAQKQMSKVQTRIFITVSMALLFYSFFYVIPTMMQMSTYYLGFPASIANFATNIIVYGAEFNGVLNALIYLSTHHEFKECNRRFVYGIIGMSGGLKMKPFKVFTTAKTIKTSNQGCRGS